MTLETRISDGWSYRADGANRLIERFGDGTGDYAFATFVADLSAAIREATNTEVGDYGDYDEMVEERDHVLDELLATCSPDDTREIGEALDELYAWAEQYDVWFGR